MAFPGPLHGPLPGQPGRLAAGSLMYGTVVAPAEVEEHLEVALGKQVTLSPLSVGPGDTRTDGAVHPVQSAPRLSGAQTVVSDRAMDAALIAVEPDVTQHWRERVLLHHRQQQWEQVQHDLSLFRAERPTPQFTLPGHGRGQSASVGKDRSGPPGPAGAPP